MLHLETQALPGILADLFFNRLWVQKSLVASLRYSIFLYYYCYFIRSPKGSVSASFYSSLITANSSLIFILLSALLCESFTALLPTKSLGLGMLISGLLRGLGQLFHVSSMPSSTSPDFNFAGENSSRSGLLTHHS